MNIDNDKRYRTMTIASVEERPDGWDVTWSDHWGMLYVTNENCKQAPTPGEVARCYEEGGNVVRGIVIGGRVYRYRPDPEATADENTALQKAVAEALKPFEALAKRHLEDIAAARRRADALRLKADDHFARLADDEARWIGHAHEALRAAIEMVKRSCTRTALVTFGDERA